MMGKITLEKKDLLLLRVPVLCFAISAGLGVALYFAAQYLTEQASRDLFIAQTNLDQTSTSVLQIAQEEETIIRYIGRYRDIEADGGVAEEDRLRLLEVIAEIRQANLLYPIAVELSEQSSQRLEYDPAELNPADPVDLQMTEITLTLPLLHEEDLTRLTDQLLASGGLLQPQTCTLSLVSSSVTDFTRIEEHMSAECALTWYTFNLSPPELISEY